MNFYRVCFIVISILTASLEISKSRTRTTVQASQSYFSFRNNYLLVWAAMMAGDWLQGPYVYALYQFYGFTKGEIGKLFIAGFGASLLLGTVVGSLADRHGRRTACLVYVVTYSLSCVTKHWSSFRVLMVGRILGGVATSLLFSSFESWVVAEHFKRGYDPEWLSDLFSKSVFIGNGLVAILAGLLANYLVDNLIYGPVAPFDAAAMCLLLGGAVIAVTWPENYGESKAAKEAGNVDGARRPASSKRLIDQFYAAWCAIRDDPKIALLGAMQSLFEASMYSFVFLWTPALSPRDEYIPHGVIFACFMVSCMAGAAICARLAVQHVPPERYMASVFGVAAVSLSVPVFIVTETDASRDWATKAIHINFLAFLLFEVTVGIFWPSMMKMRSQFIPEELRSTIMNFFRVPLNLFVCLVLYNVDKFPMTWVFALCVSFLLTCVVLQGRLTRLAIVAPGRPGTLPQHH